MVHGKASRWKDVTSGVPQGSVLVRLPFILFINDLSDTVEQDSQVLLYADDTKVYRKLRGREECIRLQGDLGELKR